MILYVDETENENMFIVTGLLMSSRESTERIYKSFKKAAKKMPVAKRDKASVFTEFKSVLLDKHYQRIKVKMIEKLSSADRQIIYSCYVKKQGYFPQALKEETYLSLLSKIIFEIDDDISIIFDAFNKRDFDERIVDDISKYNKVQAIMPRDSQKEPGLQFVDNMCSIMRMNKAGTDSYGFYSMVEKWVHEI